MGFVGNGLSKLVERALPAEGRSLHGEVLAATREYYAAHPVDLARVYPGMREAVADLRERGVATAILSNKTDAIVQRIADGLGIRALFDAIAGEIQDVPIKPDPTALLAMKRRLGAQCVVMVGDGGPDIDVARNAGTGFVGVTWGVSPEAGLTGYGRLARTPEEVAGRVLEEIAAFGGVP